MTFFDAMFIAVIIFVIIELCTSNVVRKFKCKMGFHKFEYVGKKHHTTIHNNGSVVRDERNNYEECRNCNEDRIVENKR